MPDEAELDLLAASLRADQADLEAFVESLASKLEAALPGRVRVDRWRSRLLGPRVVRGIAVDAGVQRLELDIRQGAVSARRSKLSGGIVLKSETVALEEWLRDLGAALASEAQQSEGARLALERLLIR